MDASTFGQLVANVGFPIACVAGLAVFVKILLNIYREDIKSYRQDVKDLTAQFTAQLTTMQDKYDAQYGNMAQEVKDITSEYNDRIAQITDVLQDNTLAIQHLTEELEHAKKNREVE